LPQASKQKGIAHRTAKYERLRGLTRRTCMQIRIDKIQEQSFQNLIRSRLEFSEIHRSSRSLWQKENTASSTIRRDRRITCPESTRPFYGIGKILAERGGFEPPSPFWGETD
jgi:hypothetical protein